MKLYGLIGYPLTHSFSKKYFTEKFQKEGIEDCKYELFEIKDMNDFPNIIKNNPNLRGLNVTIPYKETVIKFLDTISDAAKRIKAVNVIKIDEKGKLSGYNSDYQGFKESLLKFLPSDYKGMKSLVLGSGGAAKAVKTVLEDLEIPYQTISRKKEGKNLLYEEVTPAIVEAHHLVINTTPVGQHPNIKESPFLPYPSFTKEHYFYDLVYNPQETLFLQKGKARGAKIKGGLEMLYLQAEKTWQIWNK